MAPVKVLRIIARLNVGGPAVHCELLSKNLNKHGFETTLVAGSTEEGEASYETLFLKEHQGYKLIKLPKMRRSLNIFGDFFSLYRLVQIIKAEKPDIVHTHTAKAGFLGRTAAFLAGVPVTVHTYHGHVLSGYFSKSFSKFITFLEQTLGRKTTALVTLSPQLKEILSGEFRVAPASKFHIVPLGRELKPFLETKRKLGNVRKELRVSDSEVLLGIVGRLVPIKAHHFLLDAMEALETSVSWKLAVVGDGTLREELEKRVKESTKLKDRVLFLGWRNDLPELYSDLDISVLTSLNEGTPLSIIEAFGAGCPVLSTQVGGVADMMTDGREGLLVPSQDKQALVAALKRMMEDSSFRESCSIAGRERAMAYTDEALSERVARLYRELLKAPLST